MLRGLAIPVLVLAAAGVIATFFVTGAVANTLTYAMILVVLASGLGVYCGNTGLLSFGHAPFVALGAYGAALLTIPVAAKSALLPNLPEWLAAVQLPPAAAAVVVLIGVGFVGAVVGFVLRKMSGAAAAISTLGFLIISNSILIGASDYTRGAQAIVGVPKATTPLIVMAAAIIVVVVSRLFKESRWGLLARAAREDEPAALACGIDAAKGRWISFTLSAVITGLGGILFAHHVGVFSPKEFHFSLTFTVLAMLIVGGMRSAAGPVVGVAVVTLLIEVLRRIEPGFAIGGFAIPPMFGLTTIGVSLALLATLYFRSSGLMGQSEFDDMFRKREPGPVPAASGAARQARTGVALSADSLTKRYGGITAVAGVSMNVGPGEIVGLIGPNGSGKSTLLSCLSGVQTADEGRILVGGVELRGGSPLQFSRAGIGRTFQNIRLYTELSAFDNVKAALLGRGAVSSSIAGQQTRALLAELGLGDVEQRRAGSLSYGQQRRLEIARALATAPGCLLLDEPAAGMNPSESAELIAVLRRVRDERGLGILIVDHDLHLILSLCDRVVVLNEGKLIAAGTPAEIKANPQVEAAYFGARRGRGRPGHDPADPVPFPPAQKEPTP